MLDAMRRSVFEEGRKTLAANPSLRSALVPPGTKLPATGYPDDNSGRLCRALLSYPQQILYNNLIDTTGVGSSPPRDSIASIQSIRPGCFRCLYLVVR